MADRETGFDVPPPLELACLQALWDLKSANVGQVRAALTPARPLAYTTVMTLLDRLEKKGIVRREKAGRSFCYQPVVGREAVRTLAVRQLAQRLFEDSLEDLAQFTAMVARGAVPESGDGAVPGNESAGAASQATSLDASLL